MQQNIYLENIDSYYNIHTNRVDYYLSSIEGPLHLNALLGKYISIKIGDFNCLNCGLPKDPFQMGMCKSCYFSSPKAGRWLFNPELSTAQEGIEERDLAYEKKYQLQPHVVYLALTDKVKVGVTRKESIFTRWINQGATYATIIAQCDNRYEAGIIEAEAKKFVSDKTNTRRMIVTNPSNEDWIKEQFVEKFNELKSNGIKGLLKNIDIIYPIKYPLTDAIFESNDYKSLNEEFIKEKKVIGLKGNLIIFATENYINLRQSLGRFFLINVTLA